MLISEDLDEIMSLSDRIGVIFEGAMVGIVDGRGADKLRLVTGWRGQVRELPEVVFCPPAGNNQPVVWYFRESIA